MLDAEAANIAQVAGALNTSCLLWPPCVAHADFIFLPCGFFFFFLLFSSPNLSGHKVDVYHTSTHGVALLRIKMQV